MKKRLSKHLAATGLASRRKCEEIIFAGRVQVNGQVILTPQTLVDESDRITVDQKRIRMPEEKVYLLLNKPPGYVCSPAYKKNHKHVLDLFKALNLRLFTVGRLDKDTTGLLIITNDGHFAERVIHPSSNLEKEYVAETSSPITPRQLAIMKEGTYVENTFVKPKKVKKINAKTVLITVSEGKKREVRHLIARSGQKVETLHRTRIGGLALKNLEIGTWRKLSTKDKEALFKPYEKKNKRPRKKA